MTKYTLSSMLGTIGLTLTVLATLASQGDAQYPVSPERIRDPFPTYPTMGNPLDNGLNTLPDIVGLTQLIEIPSDSTLMVDSSQTDTSAVRGRASGRDSIEVVIVLLRQFGEAMTQRAVDSSSADSKD